MVAVGMTIGAAEQLVDTDPGAAKALLVKARESSATALQELRQLVRASTRPSSRNAASATPSRRWPSTAR